MELKKILSFLRWRIVAVRYITMLVNYRWIAHWRNYNPSLKTGQDVDNIGLSKGETIDKEVIEDIIKLYRPRVNCIEEKNYGAPFTNLMKPEDITKENPVIKLAFSKKIFDIASDYFGGHFILDSIQVMYSWPTEGKLRESQMWHKDYGDTKTFHAIIYLNDVKKIEDGPFVFINKKDTARIKRSPFVRRIDDATFSKELGNGEIQYFYGKAGDLVYIDPAACYHYGSRCVNPRMAVFITFNSSMAFTRPHEFIAHCPDKLFTIAKTLRPDLSEQYLDRVISS